MWAIPFLKEIPWVAGNLGAEVYEDTAVGKCDELAAELRDQELQLLAAGAELPELADLKELTFEKILTKRAAEQKKAEDLKPTK